jgi:virulence-associated protein VapD
MFETGISLLQDSNKKPPLDMVNSQFTDLRQYMPDLGLKAQQSSNIVDKNEVSFAYQRLESRRFKVIEALKKQLDSPFIAVKAKKQ